MEDQNVAEEVPLGQQGTVWTRIAKERERTGRLLPTVEFVVCWLLNVPATC